MIVNLKHQITEEDILSVPDFRLEIFTKQEAEYIKKVCMNLLNIAKEQNSSNEVGVLVDSHLYHIVKWLKGTEKKVRLQMDWLEITSDIAYSSSNRFIFIHNHPSTAGISLQDITSFLENEYICCIIVVRNNGGLDFLYKTTVIKQEIIDWFMTRIKTKQDFFELCEINNMHHIIKRRKVQ